MKGLMLHCGAHGVEREAVAAVDTPQRTETWTPISHEYLIDEVSRTLESSKMRIKEESHALTRDGKRYFGLFRIEGEDLASKDYSTVMGLRNWNWAAHWRTSRIPHEHTTALAWCSLSASSR